MNARIKNDNGDKLVYIAMYKYLAVNEEICNQKNYVLIANNNCKEMSVRSFICCGDPHNANVELNQYYLGDK